MFRHGLHSEFLVGSLPMQNTYGKKAYDPEKGVEAFPDRFSAKLYVERQDSDRFVFYLRSVGIKDHPAVIQLTQVRGSVAM